MVDRIEQVKQVLCDGGIRARRGFPAEKFFRPETPVAAVYLDGINGAVVTVAAQIFATKASDCEDCADGALVLLRTTGGTCMADSCRFDKQMELYSLRLLVRWDPEEQPDSQPVVPLPYTLWIGTTQIPYVTSFSAMFSGELFQNVAEDGTTSIVYNANAWILTIEQFLPAGEKMEEIQTPFTLYVKHGTFTESFSQCRWDSVRWTETSSGIRQVRVAKTWSKRVIF